MHLISFSCLRSLTDSETEWRKRKQTVSVMWRRDLGSNRDRELEGRRAASPDQLTEENAVPWAPPASGSCLLIEGPSVPHL